MRVTAPRARRPKICPPSKALASSAARAPNPQVHPTPRAVCWSASSFLSPLLWQIGAGASQGGARGVFVGFRVESSHLDGGVCVPHWLAAHHAVGGLHGNGAHGVLTQVLRHLKHHALLVILQLGGRQSKRHVLSSAMEQVEHGVEDEGGRAPPRKEGNPPAPPPARS